MSSSRCSRLTVAVALVLALVAVAAVAVPVAAVSVSPTGTPDAVETGATVGVDSELSFRLTDLYTRYESYELVVRTDLREAVWTVETLNPQGDTVDSRTVSGQNATVDVGGSVDAVEVTLEGRAPAASAVEFSYQPPQEFLLAGFAQRQSGGVASDIEEFTARPYTTASQDARDAIDAALEAVEAAESAGADVSAADTDLENAREAFDSENFELAGDLAGQAESAADSARSSENRTSLLLTIGAGVVVVAVVGGVAYWVLRNRGPADKLG